MVQDALIPVYGVFRKPLGIRLCGTGHGGSVGRGPTRVSLRFSSGDVLDPQIIVSLSSERANDRRIKHPPGYGSSPIPELALALLKEYKRELWEQSRQVSPQSITRHIVVPGFEPATELIHWGEPINLFNFALKNEEIILSVSAQGLSESELFQLISHLGVVNHNPELLAQYQVEFDQVRQAQLGL